MASDIKVLGTGRLYIRYNSWSRRGHGEWPVEDDQLRAAGGDAADRGDEEARQSGEDTGQAEYAVQRVRAGTGRPDRHPDHRQDQVVLPARVDAEEALVTMDRPPGHQH